jgi:hypothetical protein
MSWHGTALHASFAEAMAHRDRLSAEERAEFERQARLLHDAGELAMLNMDSADDGDRPEEGRQG